MDIHRDYKSLTQERWLNWLIWKCLIPLLLPILLWPILQYVFEIEYAFQKAFAGGEMLLVAAVLLLSTTEEIQQVSVISNGTRILLSGERELLSTLSRLVAILLFFTYILIKADILGHNYYSTVPIPPKLTAYAVFSITAALLSIIINIYIYWRTVESLMKQELERLADIN